MRLLLFLFNILVASVNYVIPGTFKEESTIVFLGKILKMQESPTNIVLFIHWTNDEKVKLLKYLNEMNIEATVGNSISGSKNTFQDQTMFVIDFRGPFLSSILTTANSTGLFRNPFRWIALIQNLNQIPPDLNIFIDSIFYVVVNEFNVYCLYKIFGIEGKKESYNRKLLMTWSPKKISESVTHFKDKSEMNLNGAPITISLVVTNEDTMQNLWTYRNTHIDAISKLNYILLYHALDMINATKKYVPTNTWGYKNTTTKLYSGMFGDLQTGLAQVGGTPAFFTLERLATFEFFARTARTHTKFIFRAPPLSYVQNIYILPFAVSVWYALLVLLCVVPIAIYVAVRWERRDADATDSFVDAVMLEMSAVCQQGSTTEMRHASGRIAVIFTFVTLMFLYTSYSANIVALLQSTTDRMSTLEDLLNSRIQLGVEDIVYSHYYFADSTDPLRKAIIKQKIAPQGQPENYFDIATGIQRMRDEFFAFHVELSNGYKMVERLFREHEKCGLTEVEFIKLIEPYLAMKKGYSAKDLLKIGLRRIHETGIQNREAGLIYSKKPKCLSRGSNFVSVGLIDCYFPFLIYASGFGICIALLLLEKLFFYIVHKKCTK